MLGRHCYFKVGSVYYIVVCEKRCFEFFTVKFDRCNVFVVFRVVFYIECHTFAVRQIDFGMRKPWTAY